MRLFIMIKKVFLVAFVLGMLGSQTHAFWLWKTAYDLEMEALNSSDPAIVLGGEGERGWVVNVRSLKNITNHKYWAR
jgi:hypothetical protein